MKIREYFNITQETIDAKENNIFIPICLGNKFFSKQRVITDNMRKYLEWALHHTKDRVLVLVVDKIQNTNYFVRHGKKSEEACLRHVLREGKAIKESIDCLIDGLDPEDRKKVDVITWETYEKNSPINSKTTELLYKKFQTDKDFRDSIMSAVKESVTDRVFTDEQYLRLCNYVLDEFSVVYSGLHYKEKHYNLYPYPETDAVLYLIEAIKNGLKFPELKTKLPEEKTGVVILN